MALEVADRTRVIKRTLEILNLVDAGTYSATLSVRNKTRNLAALTDAIDEAGLMILKAIAERPNEFRYLFLTDTSAITTSGDKLPLVGLQPHLGPPDAIRITIYSGGPVRDGAQRDYRKIQSYRENPGQVYDAINHNQSGSALSGYYDLWSDRFYFTGLSAVVTLARHPIRAETATSIPGIMESVWVKLAVGNAAKVGTGGYESAILANYGQQGRSDLEEFKAGGRQFREIDDPEQSSEVHAIAK